MEGWIDAWAERLIDWQTDKLDGWMNIQMDNRLMDGYVDRWIRCI